MDFDINTLEQTQQAQHRVVLGHQKIGDAGAAGVPVGFIVVGAASAQYQAIDREIQKLNIIEAGRQQGKTLNLQSDEDAGVVVDKAADRRLRIVKACTVGWFGFTDAGQEATFTPEALARVLAAKPNWVLRILAEIENDQNFNGAPLPA